MEYQGPEPADLANVHALNCTFIDWLRSGNRDPGLPAGASALLLGLDRRQREHLADTPFLLLSVREYDDSLWSGLFAQKPGMSLLRHMQSADEEGERLTAAMIGFLWQLALRNPYAARLVSGASLSWCEQLAACTLIDIVTRVAEEPVFPEARMKDNPDLWNKLLTSGVSAKRDVRLAARVSCLQTVLTGCSSVTYRRLASAACKLPRTRMRVADPRRR